MNKFNGSKVLSFSIETHNTEVPYDDKDMTVILGAFLDFSDEVTYEAFKDDFLLDLDYLRDYIRVRDIEGLERIVAIAKTTTISVDMVDRDNLISKA